MKKFILAFFIIFSPISMANLITTDPTEQVVDVQDIYDSGITLNEIGDLLGTHSQYWNGQFDIWFNLPEESNVIVVETPALDFFYTVVMRLGYGGLNENVILQPSDVMFTDELAFVAKKPINEFYFSIRTSDTAYRDYVDSGIMVRNFRYGTYNEPATSVDAPRQTIGMFLIGLFVMVSMRYFANKKQKAKETMLSAPLLA